MIFIKDNMDYIRYVESNPEASEKEREDAKNIKQMLINHYKELYSYYIDKNRDIENIEQLYNIQIENLVNVYINIDYIVNDNFDAYARSRLKKFTKNKEWENNTSIYDRPIEELTQKALNGDKSSRDKLIEINMRMVDNLAELSEDEKQEGYLRLIRLVDMYIEKKPENMYLSTYISVNLLRKLSIKLKRDREKEKENRKLIQKNVTTMSSEEYLMYKMEFIDFINGEVKKPREKYILNELYNGRTCADIAQEMGISRERISYISRTIKKKVIEFNKN